MLAKFWEERGILFSKFQGGEPLSPYPLCSCMLSIHCSPSFNRLFLLTHFWRKITKFLCAFFPSCSILFSKTFQERIALLASGQHKPESSNETSTDLKKRKLSDSADEESPTSNKPKKRGPKVKKMGKAGKMKIISDSYVKPEVEQDETVLMNAPSVIETSVPCRKNKDFSVQEISPFENVPTYKCTFCSKRSQDLKKIEQHLRTEHSTRSGSSENETGENNFESGYKTLTRDQVVDLLTMSATSSHDEHSTESKFICYYCEVNWLICKCNTFSAQATIYWFCFKGLSLCSVWVSLKKSHKSWMGARF